MVHYRLPLLRHRTCTSTGPPHRRQSESKDPAGRRRHQRRHNSRDLVAKEAVECTLFEVSAHVVVRVHMLRLVSDSRYYFLLAFPWVVGRVQLAKGFLMSLESQWASPTPRIDRPFLRQQMEVRTEYEK